MLSIIRLGSHNNTKPCVAHNRCIVINSEAKIELDLILTLCLMALKEAYHVYNMTH